jgi:hypothetical protein
VKTSNLPEVLATVGVKVGVHQVRVANKSFENNAEGIRKLGMVLRIECEEIQARST